MGPTYIFWYLVIGMIAGLLAGRFIRGRGLGLTGNLVASDFGALMGGYLFNAWRPAKSGGMLGAILFATLGSVIVLGILGWLRSLPAESEEPHQA